MTSFEWNIGIHVSVCIHLQDVRSLIESVRDLQPRPDPVSINCYCLDVMIYTVA